ncbi:MAG: 4-(cytidine 5'-diphospho)-2-C-methyl-D-erythritol kinase [Armatimonadetes bacterium]|nr:4-(cytidine 5'-diphospho)-2-C-methyl-D-erythritol kinase [Armatimonadota bacterium]
MSLRRAVTVRAYAKVNLCLEVLGRRQDGYHDLATVFAAVSLHDTLTLTLERGHWVAGAVELAVDGWAVPRGPENLVVRAAKLLMKHAGEVGRLPGGLRVSLTKRIPPGGGLGGGSADAAATLVGLKELLALELGPEELVTLAAELGSDVAFFASQAPAALGEGRGERLSPLPAPRLPALTLVWPGEPVGTAWAYGLLTAQDFSDGDAARSLAEALNREDELQGHPALGRNAFLRPVLEVRPDLAVVMQRLEEAGARVVSLAGSGACLWGAFADIAEAADAARALEREGLWAQPVTPVAAGVELIR